MTYHIIPTGDLFPHIHDEACGCNPSVQVVEGDRLYVHNTISK